MKLILTKETKACSDTCLNSYFTSHPLNLDQVTHYSVSFSFTFHLSLPPAKYLDFSLK